MCDAKAYHKAYGERPEQRAWRKIYNNRPDVKERRKKQQQSPKGKAQARILHQKERMIRGLSPVHVPLARNPGYNMFCEARSAAKRRGLEFSIKLEEITVPETCPILGMPLVKGVRQRLFSSPSLDRIDSSRGYVPGNVWVISWRANHLKSNGTLIEFRQLVAALEKLAT